MSFGWAWILRRYRIRRVCTRSGRDRDISIGWREQPLALRSRVIAKELRNPEAKKNKSTRRQAASPDWRLRILFYSCSVFAGGLINQTAEPRNAHRRRRPGIWQPHIRAFGRGISSRTRAAQGGAVRHNEQHFRPGRSHQHGPEAVHSGHRIPDHVGLFSRKPPSRTTDLSNVGRPGTGTSACGHSCPGSGRPRHQGLCRTGCPRRQRCLSSRDPSDGIGRSCCCGTKCSHFGKSSRDGEPDDARLARFAAGVLYGGLDER